MSRHIIRQNYRDDDKLRMEFFEFTEIIFPGVNFREWYARGFWKDGYIPFSIIKDDRIISNASVTRMDILVDGRVVRGIQFGTVGTLPEYREQGLARLLMEYLLERYQDETDVFFLFANETVLDFYPKFGFIPHQETIFKAEAILPCPNFRARLLDINHPADMDLIQNLLQRRLDLTGIFGARNYDFITLWHVLNVFPKHLYYVAEDEVIFIISDKGEKLHVWDVIYTRPLDISRSLAKVIKNDGLKSILYYFPPDKLEFEYDATEIMEDSGLFIRRPFAIVDKPFKFPTTAQT